MLATLFAAAVSTLGSCSTCGVAGREVTLCETHAAEERAVLQREAGRLNSKDAAARKASLDAVAALTEAHTDAPSAAVAKRIGSALDDESMEVRAHAAGLLGRPQHALASLDALVLALAATKKEVLPLNAEFDSLTTKLAAKQTDKRRAELQAARKACDEKRSALVKWRHTLVEQLVKFPDDRAVDAILTHTHRNLLTAGEEALVRLGNRKAVRALIESFSACDRDLEVAEKETPLRKAESGYGPNTLGAKLIDFAVENMHAASTSARQKLEACFAERGLQPPDANASTASWKRWIELNLSAFPEHLPGIVSPVW